MSCTCPVMRANGSLLSPGVHMNIVKSSLPLIRRSGLPPVAVLYRSSALDLASSLSSGLAVVQGRAAQL